MQRLKKRKLGGEKLACGLLPCMACDEGGCSASTHTKRHHTKKLITVGGSYMSETDAEAKLACLPEQLLLLSCGWLIDAWIDAIGI